MRAKATRWDLRAGTVAVWLAAGCDFATPIGGPSHDGVPNVAAISAGDADDEPTTKTAESRAPAAAPKIAFATDAALAAHFGDGPDAALDVHPWKSEGGFVALSYATPIESGLVGHLAVLDDDRHLVAETALDLRDVCPGDGDGCERAWLDLAPFRIAPDEVAVGLRVRIHDKTDADVGTDEKLLLYRVGDGQMRQIAKIHMASDWHRAKESTVLIVTKREHNGLFDLRQRGEESWSIGLGEARRDGEESVSITWQFDGERYVIRPPG